MKPKGAVLPPQLIGEDGNLKGNQDSVDYLNSYFASIGEKLSDDLTAQGYPKIPLTNEYEPLNAIEKICTLMG